MQPQKKLLVSSVGFSKTAKIRADSDNIEIMVLKEQDAILLNWRELARKYTFPVDEACHAMIADGYSAFYCSKEPWDWIDALDGILYEEWIRIMDEFKRIDSEKYREMLRQIAISHPDDGWRFNAITRLEAYEDKEFFMNLLNNESDEDIINHIETYIMEEY